MQPLKHQIANLESFLLRLLPNLASERQGASEAEIAQLETIAGRPLPAVYRWFLQRMGKDMGAMSYPTLDFSAVKVLSCYRDGLVEPDHPSLTHWNLLNSSSNSWQDPQRE